MVRRQTAFGVATLLLAAAALTPAAAAQGTRLIDRAGYQDKLRGMWLGELIANWTGIRTEGARQAPPFFTDADWGATIGNTTINYVWWLDPWWADDDTDLEYVYLHLLSTAPAGPSRNRLTPGQVWNGWRAHVNRYIWVSNAEARALMDRGVRPPATGLPIVNRYAYNIDAQLTTEVFGALCPGMPERALEMADLPIRTTASGYAAHASLFYVALYSLATQAPDAVRAQGNRATVLWLTAEARKFIPDSSKAADVIDFVTADFLANPDPEDWERTRDLVADRYQTNAAAHGWLYRGWTESSVNLAGGLMALLYGNLDYRKTVRVGALSGWDSDNGTATMGGLVGLMIGTQAIRDQFPGLPLSDRYWIGRTRDGLPDYLPGDPEAEDTLTMMVGRMLPIIDREVGAAGGALDASAWLLPPPAAYASPVKVAGSPSWREWARSANGRERAAGRPPTGLTTAPTGSPVYPGWYNPALVCNAYEQDFTGFEDDYSRHAYYSSQGSGSGAGALVTLTVLYAQPVEVHTVRFIEGDHLADGGWFTDLTVEVLRGGAWTAPAAAATDTLDPARPWQIIDYVLAAPMAGVAGVRVSGHAGGAGVFVTCAELDALSAPAPAPAGTFDLSADGGVTVDDLYTFEEAPIDLDGSGAAGPAGRRYLEAALRWGSGAVTIR